MSELSGSPAVNPKPAPRAVKDRAKFHKVISTRSIRDIINQSDEDDTQPKPVI